MPKYSFEHEVYKKDLYVKTGKKKPKAKKYNSIYIL